MIPDATQPPYQVYPLVDHVADKLAAMYELHGPSLRPSTRFKDLVDLVAIVTQASITATDQRRAGGDDHVPHHQDFEYSHLPQQLLNNASNACTFQQMFVEQATSVCRAAMGFGRC